MSPPPSLESVLMRTMSDNASSSHCQYPNEFLDRDSAGVAAVPFTEKAVVDKPWQQQRQRQRQRQAQNRLQPPKSSCLDQVKQEKGDASSVTSSTTNLDSLLLGAKVDKGNTTNEAEAEAEAEAKDGDEGEADEINSLPKFTADDVDGGGGYYESSESLLIYDSSSTSFSMDNDDDDDDSTIDDDLHDEDDEEKEEGKERNDVTTNVKEKDCMLEPRFEKSISSSGDCDIASGNNVLLSASPVKRENRQTLFPGSHHSALVVSSLHGSRHSVLNDGDGDDSSCDFCSFGGDDSNDDNDDDDDQRSRHSSSRRSRGGSFGVRRSDSGYDSLRGAGGAGRPLPARTKSGASSSSSSSGRRRTMKNDKSNNNNLDDDESPAPATALEVLRSSLGTQRIGTERRLEISNHTRKLSCNSSLGSSNTNSTTRSNRSSLRSALNVSDSDSEDNNDMIDSDDIFAAKSSHVNKKALHQQQQQRRQQQQQQQVFLRSSLSWSSPNTRGRPKLRKNPNHDD